MGERGGVAQALKRQHRDGRPRGVRPRPRFGGGAADLPDAHRLLQVLQLALALEPLAQRRYYAQNCKWTPERVDHNIFQAYDVSYICAGSPTLDLNSIMMYDIRPELTLDRRGVRAARDISPTDAVCMSNVYGTA
jgi:hypothetical protein